MLRFRRLGIDVRTQSGLEFGADLSFGDGLVILRANNTSGKSTCIMALLYALGLEGMLGPGNGHGLQSAVTRRIKDFQTGAEHEVVQSRVRLLVENAHELAEFTRTITGALPEPTVVDVTRKDSSGKKFSEEYLVRVQGGATSERGFHAFLAEFMGLNLPTLARADGILGPLYLECLMPYFFIDQLTGWRDIKSRMPTYLRIPEMGQRSAEFVLDLDVLTTSARLEELLVRERQLRDQWIREGQRLEATASVYGGVVRRLDGTPPPNVHTDLPFVVIPYGERWHEVDDLIGLVDEVAAAPILAEPVQPDQQRKGSVEVDQLRIAVTEAETLVREASVARSLEQQQIVAIRQRVEQVRKHLNRYKDLERLQKRGALVNVSSVAKKECPSCHRTMSDVASQHLADTPLMSIDENLAYYQEQMHMLAHLETESELALAVATAKLQQCFEASGAANARYRAAQLDYGAPTTSGTTAKEIQRQLEAAALQTRLRQARTRFKESLDILNAISEEFVEILRQKRELGRVSLSAGDLAKLRWLSDDFRAQLGSFGFASETLERVEVNSTTYRPAVDGHDVGLTSASDAIRIVWAYHLALLECARHYQTNHPGFLILDEPRQQSADRLSFRSLLRRAALAGESGQQVIFATSEDVTELQGMISGIEADLQLLPKPIIAPRG